MMQVQSFAPVETVHVTEAALARGVLTGSAVPPAGPKPCAVLLAAGDRTIAVARATRFSLEARQRGNRLGWCGFRIGGLAQAVALGSDLELRCWVSGRVLRNWAAADLVTRLHPIERQPLALTALRALIQMESYTPERSQILPFAHATARMEGTRAMLEASYRYLLGRPLDPARSAREFDKSWSIPMIEQIWDEILASEEFRARGLPVFRGPFEGDFPFSLTTLDDIEANRPEKP